MRVSGSGSRVIGLIRDERGQYAVATLLILVGMIVLLGMIVDVGRAYAVRRLLQGAVDAAAQAAAHQVDPAFSGRDVRLHMGAAMQTAYNYMSRNTPHVEIAEMVVAVDPAGHVMVTARARVPCSFLRLIGIREVRPLVVGKARTEFGINAAGQ